MDLKPVYKTRNIKIYQGDAFTVLHGLKNDVVQTCVTSPPYWGLRDYGVDGQIGSGSLEQYIEDLVTVFREVKRVLREDGTLWLNLGDSYVQKNLVGMPWRVALALQADDWYLRQDIIWHKPNPMPESVQDRCVKAHEYIFLLSKNQKYYYDVDSIKEKSTGRSPGNKNQKYVKAYEESDDEIHRTKAGLLNIGKTDKRNRRTVWTVAPAAFKGAHFATFPPDLIKPCILAGAPKRGIVLDPFLGSGTTAMVSQEFGRRCIGIELNPEYIEIAKKRVKSNGDWDECSLL